MVGWEHFYDGGAGRMHNHVDSGAVKFNLGAFNAASGRKIKKATLSYTGEAGSHVPSAGFFETDPMALRLSTVFTWAGAPSVYPAPPAMATVPYMFLPWSASEVPTALIGATVVLEVTPIVMDWADGSKLHGGFVLQSMDVPSYGAIADNDEWWQVLRDFHLEIEWTL